MNKIIKQRTVLETFQRALDQSAFVLRENPELTFPQIYNRAQWEKDNDKLLNTKLNSEEKKYKKPWLKLLTRSEDNTAYIRTFKGHSEVVKACDFSPDGKYMATCSYDKTIKIWDSRSWNSISTFKGHILAINDIAFTPDGKYLVSAGDDSLLRLWELESGKEINTFKGHEGWVLSCDINHEGKILVSSGLDKTIRLWELDSGKELTILRGHGLEINDCSFSADDRYIVTASDDTTLKLWNANQRNSKQKSQGHSSWVLDCSFSPDGKLLVSASADKTLKIWDTKTRQIISTLRGHKSAVTECKFSNDGEKVSSYSTSGIKKLWNVRKVKEITTLKNEFHQIPIENRELNRKHKIESDLEYCLNLIDAESEKHIGVILQHQNKLMCFSLSPDAQTLALGDQSGQILFFLLKNFPGPATVSKRKTLEKKLKKLQVTEKSGYVGDFMVICNNFLDARILPNLYFALKSIDTPLLIRADGIDINFREVLSFLSVDIKYGDWILMIYDKPLEITDLISPLIKDGYLKPIN